MAETSTESQKTVIMTYLCTVTTPHLLPAPKVTSSWSLPASYKMASRIEQSMTGLIIKNMKIAETSAESQKTVIMTYHHELRVGVLNRTAVRQCRGPMGSDNRSEPSGQPTGKLSN